LITKDLKMSEKAVFLIILLLVAILLVLTSNTNLSLFSLFNAPKKIQENLNLNLTQENTSSHEYPIAQIPLGGFIPANISVDAILIDKAQVSLKTGCYLIEATTDACVASAINKAIEGKVDFRPTVYDVINDIFRNLGIKVLAVKITEMRDNTFIGQLIVQQKDKVLVLDIRPSDATAIALRTKAPIYINETLAKEVGKYIC
jgi:bifunctional DNase/RNase